MISETAVWLVLLGAFISVVGVFVFCALCLASQADDQMDEMMRKMREED
jgi:type VI protein secretion system component VasF